MMDADFWSRSRSDLRDLKIGDLSSVEERGGFGDGFGSGFGAGFGDGPSGGLGDVPGESIASLVADGAAAGGNDVLVAVVEPDREIRRHLAVQLGDRAVTVAAIDELEAHLGLVPVVLVLGPAAISGADHDAAGQLLATRSDVGAVWVVHELSTERFQQALRLGVRDVLALPVDAADLRDAVARVSGEVAHAGVDPSNAGLPGGSIAGVLAADARQTGRLVGVLSTKGGAGTSVVATNLAVELARRSDRPVVLIDADLQFGDVAVMLKLTPQHTIIDAVSALGAVDEGLLESLLVRHEPSGLLVLPAPLEPALADRVGPSELSAIIEILRRTSAWIVVDTPSYFNDVVLQLVDECDDLVLVAGMDIPNVKNAKLGLQTLRLLDAPMSKVHLVMNREGAKGALAGEDVERALQLDAVATLPADDAVPTAVNRGAAVVLDAPRAPVSKALTGLAERFAPIESKGRSGLRLRRR